VLRCADECCSCPHRRHASLVPTAISCRAHVCPILHPQRPVIFLCIAATESKRIEVKGLSPSETNREIFIESQLKIKRSSNWGYNRHGLLVAHARNPTLINRNLTPPPATTHPLFPIVTRNLEINTAKPFRCRPCHSNWSRSITGIRGTHFLATANGRSLRITAAYRLQTEKPPTKASPSHRLPCSKTDSGELPSSPWSCRKKPHLIPSTVEPVRAPPYSTAMSSPTSISLMSAIEEEAAQPSVERT
jgi:hypothetical protein